MLSAPHRDVVIILVLDVVIVGTIMNIRSIVFLKSTAQPIMYTLIFWL